MFLHQVLERIEALAESRVDWHHFYSRQRIKTIDKTIVQLMAPRKTRRIILRPPGRPRLRVLGDRPWRVLDLASGTLSDFVTHPYRDHDIKAFYEFRGHFRTGDPAVGDLVFCS